MTKKNPILASSGAKTHSYEIRKIENGFIMRHSQHGDGDYTSKETFHPTQPTVAVEAAPKAALAPKAKPLPKPSVRAVNSSKSVRTRKMV